MSPSEKKKITRVRSGCHRCKKLKVKCPEQKPACATCFKAGVKCDYSLKLTWGGRPFKNAQRHKAAQTHGSAPSFHASAMARDLSSQGTSRTSTIEFVPSDFNPSDSSATPMGFASSVESTGKIPVPMSREGTSISGVNTGSTPQLYIKSEFAGSECSGPSLDQGLAVSVGHPHPANTESFSHHDMSRESYYATIELREDEKRANEFKSNVFKSNELKSNGSISVAQDPSKQTSLAQNFPQQDFPPQTFPHRNVSEQSSPSTCLKTPHANKPESNKSNAPNLSYINNPMANNDEIPIVSTPDFFRASPNIDTPQTDNPYQVKDGIDYSDTFSADLARIERTFPTEQRSPFFDNLFGHTPPRKDSPNAEEAEMQLVNVLDNMPKTSNPQIQKRQELYNSVAMHSIPPSLVPLPELLLRVPYYRQLLHFWVNVAAENLVPAPYLYKDNPFKKILPQMAMHYPGLLTTILAFAARARDDLEGSYGTHQKIIDQLLGRSCDELLKQLQDDKEATSDGTFATSLLLSSFEVVHSNDFNKHRAHATGASQIMVARTKKVRNSADPPGNVGDDASPSSSESSVSRRNESDIAYFLSRWFMYVDVIGALSSTRDRFKYLRAYRNSPEYTPIENIPHLSADECGRDIDFLLGFDPKLLPHFVNISLLIDEVEKYVDSPASGTSCLPIFIVAGALELKEKFFRSYEAGEAQRSMVFDEMIERNGRSAASKSKDLMTKDNILRSTNRLYYDTGLLNLYRRVLLLPRSSPLVIDLISEMTEIFEYYIEPCSPAEICTIFGLFCAGCDNMNVAKRDFFRHRFELLARQENMNATKSLMIMERCWSTGEDWYTAANMLDIDLVLM